MKQNNIFLSLGSVLDNGSLRWLALLAATTLWYTMSIALISDPLSYAPLMMPLLGIFLLFCLGVSYTGMLRLRQSHRQIWLKLGGFLILSVLLCGSMPWTGMGFTAFVSWLAMRNFSEATPNKMAREGAYINENAHRIAVNAEKEKPIGDSGILLGGVRHATKSFTKNTLIVGTVGSGKSVTLKLIARDALAGIGSGIDKRALLYDPSGEWPSILEAMGFPSQSIIYTNPLDQRCRPWAMSKDVKTSTQAAALAEILIPIPPSVSDPFWLQATQICIISVVRYFNSVAPGQWTFRDLLIAVRDQQIILKMCEDEPRLQHYVQVHGSDKTAANIMASVISNTQKYEIIAALWHKAETVYCNQPFSLREWINGSSILVLSRSTTAEKELREVNRIMFTRTMQLLMDQPEKSHPTTWMFLDEIGSLGKLEALLTAATELRKRGVAIVGGFQALAHVIENFNENIADTIVGQFGHIAALRLTDRKTKEWLRHVAGKVRYERWTEGVQKSYSQGKTKSTTQTFGEEDNLRQGSLSDIPIFEPELGKGMKGLYISGDRKWWHTYEPSIVQQLPPRGDSSRNLILMPEEYQELEPWTLDDWQRLDILHLQEDSFEALPEGDMTITQLLDEPPTALPEGSVEEFLAEVDEKVEADVVEDDL